jgi:methionyl-tRNA formyltransferase
MKIVFMGTPDFAVPSLEILIENNYDVVGVVTAMDKPAGRGKKLQMSPVKQFALEKGLRVFQPENLKNLDFVNDLSSLEADLFVVVAFRMLPEVVWKIPRKGTFNLHGSLLPQYRGAAPINWAIINGEKETGVTTFFIDEKIDTGQILFFKKTSIGDHTTAGELHDKLMLLGAELVLKTVKAIDVGKYMVMHQNDLVKNGLKLKAAPKIDKETCKINWQDDAVNVHNHIRGLSPFPGAWTWVHNLNNGELLNVKIFKSHLVFDSTLKPGEIKTDGQTFLHVGTAFGSVSVDNLQFPGRKRLDVSDFLRGTSIDPYLISL